MPFVPASNRADRRRKQGHSRSELVAFENLDGSDIGDDQQADFDRRLLGVACVC